MAKVIWMTGLSASGKTTIAKALQKDLGESCINLDGDVIRNMFYPIGFSKKERDTNVGRAAYLVKILSPFFETIICSFISPYEETRQAVQKKVEDVKIVYVKCSIDECKRRDPKGLYAKAITGEIPHFTGISDPYEEPRFPDLMIHTDTMSVDECVKKVKELLKDESKES